MKRVATVVALCFAALSAQGQEACTHPKIVKTTGTAELKVTPDQAVIQLGIEHQSSTAKNAKTVVANTSRKILAQPSQLRTFFGFFALIFIVKRCVFIVAL